MAKTIQPVSLGDGSQLRKPLNSKDSNNKRGKKYKWFEKFFFKKNGNVLGAQINKSMLKAPPGTISNWHRVKERQVL